MSILKNIKTSDSDSNMAKRIRLLQISGAVLVCCLMLGIFLYCYIKYGKEIASVFGSAESLETFLAQFHGYDKWVFVAIRAFQTVIKIIPAEPLEIGSGVLYGTWGGMALCLLGTLIGSFVIIALTRAFGRRLVDVFIPIEKINSLKFLQNRKKVYVSLFFIYLIPGTPKDVLTYAAGITNLDMKKFLLITGIARIPSILTSTWCGEQLLMRNFELAIIIFAATAILSIVCSVIYQKYSSAKEQKASPNAENREDADT